VHEAFVNLTFHGIGSCERPLDEGEDTVWVSEARYDAALDAVASRRDVRLSFDDGNASDVELGLPGLERRGLTATFFVVADRIDRPGFLSAEDLRLLLDAGMSIGCHGMRHRPWRETDDDALHEELVTARAAIEAAAGTKVTTAACPFGSYDRRVLRTLRRAGYERVYTSDRGPAREDEWLQARTSITEQDADLDPILSLRRPPLARRAKQLVKRWR
jgi:peptidoglycan/xylan/chitin deacetylase (PgdA/CDA1 family)